MIDEDKIPEAPAGVDHRALWYEIGKSNAKLDLLVEALPDLEKRMTSLEHSRVQVYTAAGLVTAAAGAIAAYGKKFMEFIA
jgi:hypothetical protein